MFGSRRNRIDGKLRNVFDHIYQKRVTFETSMTLVEDGNKRVYDDLCQLMTNSNELVTNTMLNIEEESALIHGIDEFSKELRGVVGEYEQLKKEVDHQLHVAAALVEDNKHYTTPAKYLVEVPNALKERRAFANADLSRRIKQTTVEVKPEQISILDGIEEEPIVNKVEITTTLPRL